MTFELSSRAMTLSTRPFGFDKEEVRICIENLTRDYEDARREIDRLTAELQVAATKSRQPLQETVGVQVERVLAGAYRIAEEVKSEAESTAKQLLREAQEEAAQLRTQAAADAAALTRTAATRVAELESEIQEMTDRRQVVQAMLDRAADRLNQIAQDMRQGVIPPASPVQGHPQAPRAQEAAIL